MSDRMIDRYGRSRIAEIVVGFYQEILRSPTLGHYFADANMERLIDHQGMFLATFMGGARSFSRDQIRATHNPFHIAEDDFDEMLRIIERWLHRSGVTPDDTEIVMARYRQLRAYVVSRNGAAGGSSGG